MEHVSQVQPSNNSRVKFSISIAASELMPDFFLDDKCQNTVHASQYAVLGKGQSASAASASAPTPPKAGTAPSSGAGGRNTIAPDSDVGKLVATIKGAITDEIVQKTKAIFQFDITGKKAFFMKVYLESLPHKNE